MNPWVLIVSSLGGIVAFVSGIAFVVRAIVSNVNATKDNTKSLNILVTLVDKMRGEFDDMKIRMAVIEDRKRR